jgi:FkbM family methyltransferase
MKIQAELNGTSRRFEIVQACVGSRSGWNHMVDSGVQGGNYFVQPSRDHAGKELTRTRSITLDALAERLKAYPTHVKIDVEGCEEDVLQGGRKTLSGTERPLLFIELHNQIVSERGGNPRGVLALLREFGYETLASDGSRLDPSQILSKPLLRIIANKAK